MGCAPISKCFPGPSSSLHEPMLVDSPLPITLLTHLGNVVLPFGLCARKTSALQHHLRYLPVQCKYGLHSQPRDDCPRCPNTAAQQSESEEFDATALSSQITITRLQHNPRCPTWTAPSTCWKHRCKADPIASPIETFCSSYFINKLVYHYDKM